MTPTTQGASALPLSGAQERSVWQPSWPLLVAVYAALFGLYMGHVNQVLLLDGDTYSHIAAGRWMMEHQGVPQADPFSHSVPGAPWITQEWLSQLVLAWAHALGGWNAVVAVTVAAFAATVALLTRALLRFLEPPRALLFAGIAMVMLASHLLARPHIIVMPVLMAWIIELFDARADDRPPRLWMLPLTVLWANLHGSFTLGLGIAVLLAVEAALAAWGTPRLPAVIQSWGIFLVAAAACALATPNGVHAYLFTWQALVEDQYALQRVGEWASPNFHHFQPLEVWLLGGLALALHQGLRLPLIRLLMLLGLTHLALKHLRSVEYLGLIGSLAVAGPFGAQWARAATPADRDDLLFRRLATPAGAGAVAIVTCLLTSAAILISAVRPAEPPKSIAPQRAIAAAQAAGLKGPVLNSYMWGGYLIYSGIPDFIDGRSDMYRDAFIRQYTDAVELARTDALDKVIDKYGITWTLLPPGTPAIALLDRMPGWRRIYVDETAVVHAKLAP